MHEISFYTDKPIPPLTFLRALTLNNNFMILILEESIGFVKIFDFQFSMNLHVLGCSEYDLSISGKCLSVCPSVCL